MTFAPQCNRQMSKGLSLLAIKSASSWTFEAQVFEGAALVGLRFLRLGACRIASPRALIILWSRHRNMATSVTILHPGTGLTRKGYFGFSWTYLFFGWWVPLFRGELGVAALHLLFTLLTFGLWQFIVAFLYNRQYMTRMLEKGYTLADTDDRMAQARRALGIVTL